MRETPTGRTRTEHDLRTALTSLEQYAPDAQTVLRAVRDASGPRGVLRRRGPARLAPWWRKPQLVLPIAAAAAAAILLIILLPGTGSPGSGPAQRAASAGLPAATAVARAMLAAFDAASDDVEYVTTTWAHDGAISAEDWSWSWPAQPSPGQRQTDRTLESNQGWPGSSALKRTEDVQAVFVTPTPAHEANPQGQVTTVCFLGSGLTSCGPGDTSTPAGSWSRLSASVSDFISYGPDSIFNPAELARDIGRGAWRVVRRSRLDGQQVIELDNAGRGFLIVPTPTLLWINAQTYLPIREVSGTASAGPWTVTTGFRYLPPAAASLALLQVPIPAGYSRYIPKP